MTFQNMKKMNNKIELMSEDNFDEDYKPKKNYYVKKIKFKNKTPTTKHHQIIKNETILDEHYQTNNLNYDDIKITNNLHQTIFGHDDVDIEAITTKNKIYETVEIKHKILRSTTASHSSSPPMEWSDENTNTDICKNSHENVNVDNKMNINGNVDTNATRKSPTTHVTITFAGLNSTIDSITIPKEDVQYMDMNTLYKDWKLNMMPPVPLLSNYQQQHSSSLFYTYHNTNYLNTTIQPTTHSPSHTSIQVSSSIQYHNTITSTPFNSMPDIPPSTMTITTDTNNVATTMSKSLRTINDTYINYNNYDHISNTLPSNNFIDSNNENDHNCNDTNILDNVDNVKIETSNGQFNNNFNNMNGVTDDNSNINSNNGICNSYNNYYSNINENVNTDMNDSNIISPCYQNIPLPSNNVMTTLPLHTRNDFRIGTCLFYCHDEKRLFWSFPLRNTKRVTSQHWCSQTSKIMTRSVGLRSKKCNGDHHGPCVVAIANGRPPPNAVKQEFLKLYQYFHHYYDQQVVLENVAKGILPCIQNISTELKFKKNNNNLSNKHPKSSLQPQYDNSNNINHNRDNHKKKTFVIENDDKKHIEMYIHKDDSVHLIENVKKINNDKTNCRNKKINIDCIDINNDSNNDVYTMNIDNEAYDKNENINHHSSVNGKMSFLLSKHKFNNNTCDEIPEPSMKRQRFNQKNEIDEDDYNNYFNKNDCNHINHSNFSVRELLACSRTKLKKKEFNFVINMLLPVVNQITTTTTTTTCSNEYCSININTDDYCSVLSEENSIDSQNTNTNENENEDSLRICLNLAIACYYGRRSNEALQYCNWILENQTNKISLNSLKIKYHARKLRAKLFFSQGNYQRACQDYDYIADHNPYHNSWRDKIHKDITFNNNDNQIKKIGHDNNSTMTICNNETINNKENRNYTEQNNVLIDVSCVENQFENINNNENNKNNENVNFNSLNTIPSLNPQLSFPICFQISNPYDGNFENIPASIDNINAEDNNNAPIFYVPSKVESNDNNNNSNNTRLDSLVFVGSQLNNANNNNNHYNINVDNDNMKNNANNNHNQISHNISSNLKFKFSETPELDIRPNAISLLRNGSLESDGDFVGIETRLYNLEQ